MLPVSSLVICRLEVKAASKEQWVWRVGRDYI